MVERLVGRRGAAEAAGVVALLLILGLQLALSVRQESQTWDEGDHIFAGYMTWTRADFGLNPEHPPLLKLLATAPLLNTPLRVPELQERYFKEEAFLDGKEFLYRNDADAILFRTRMAAAVLTLLTALLVFAATREMFGSGAAFVALALLAFEPNLLAHGALVTTDAGISCFMFATVYAFYRYVKAPSMWRLLVVGVSAGLALAVKHSGIFVFPVLFLLAVCEVVRQRVAARRNTEADSEAATGTGRRALRLAASLVAVTVVALAVLWAFYGFRYQARPGGLQLSPSLAQYVSGLKPREAWVISTAASWRVLPESYLYGMADVRLTADFYTSYILGKTYAHGVWFYFPVVFVIKSTLAFLALLLLAAAAVVTRRLNCWREVLFLTVPPAFYFLVAVNAATNIGVRHILPLYVFISALAGGAAWAFMRRDRRWAYAVAALLLFHAGSSALAFPHYIAYSNELWGGPGSTHKYLSDSNADWGEQLKATKKDLDGRGVKDCWFVYFAEGVAEPAYYGIPCKPLPTINTLWLNQRIEVPASIDGLVLVSASNLSGFEFGPGPLNPYEQFKQLRPTAIVGGGVFVFDGRFEVPLASALSRVQTAQNLLAAGQTEQALSEAQAAVALAPEAVQTRMMLGDVLAASGRREEARAEYEKALSLAKTIEPEFQVRSVPDIERKLSGE
ncbi:MAG TPA: glycosyltransferase family 39 protein [Pyrinomonadaceae bacterium]|jgi:tetratricopeptide (TPR) repeat protein|nr:glycosyltransferase family 39 protein [Pyrinomonadaceae bacterium]